MQVSLDANFHDTNEHFHFTCGSTLIFPGGSDYL